MAIRISRPPPLVLRRRRRAAAYYAVPPIALVSAVATLTLTAQTPVPLTALFDTPAVAILTLSGPAPSVSAGAVDFVKLLLHCDGTLGSTIFVDSSTSSHVVTAQGGAKVDTAQSEFGGASAFISDSAADYLALDGSSDFTFGTGDFTIDFWTRLNTAVLPDYFMDFRDSSNLNAPVLYYDGGGLHYKCAAADRITYATTLTSGTWYHIAVTRAGTSTKLFLNGTQVGSTYTASDNLPCATAGPRIGVTAIEEAETATWAAAVVTAGGTVSTTRRRIVNGLILGLKTDGIWSKLDRLWLFAAENSQSALIDIVAVDQASLVGAPTFTTDTGYTCNGTVYVDTTFNFSTQGVTFIQNSAHMAVWSLTDGTDAGVVTATGTGSQITAIYCKFVDGNCYARINDASASGAIVAVADARGFFVGNRSGSASREIYRNGVSLGSSGAATSQAPQNTTMLAFSRQQAAISAGGSLNSTEQLALYNRLRTHMTALGVP